MQRLHELQIECSCGHSLLPRRMFISELPYIVVEAVCPKCKVRDTYTWTFEELTELAKGADVKEDGEDNILAAYERQMTEEDDGA